MSPEQQQQLRDDVAVVMASLGAEPIQLHIGRYGFTQLALPAVRLSRLLAYACVGHQLLHSDPHEGPHPTLVHLASLTERSTDGRPEHRDGAAGAEAPGHPV